MMNKPFPFALGVLLAAASCDGGTVSPTEAVSLDLPRAESRVGSRVTTSVIAHATFIWTVDQSADALAACTPRPGLAVGSGEGEASRLGRFEIVRMDHCSVDLAAVPPILDAAGVVTWRAADGSTLEGSYSFLFLPPEDGGFFTLTVAGGTGRFAGATGRLDVDPDRSGPTVCEDPLCLDEATFPAVLTGWISLPRP